MAGDTLANFARTSDGSAAPPEITTSRQASSLAASPSSLLIAWIRVGTAGRTLARTRRSSSRKPFISKRGSITTWVPLHSGTFMQTVIAKMWKNGSTATTLLGG